MKKKQTKTPKSKKDYKEMKNYIFRQRNWACK